MSSPFQPIIGAGDLPPVFEGYSVPDGVMRGDPHETIHYHVVEPALGVNCGFWVGQPGVIRFDGFPWNEFCTILDGELHVYPDGQKEPIVLRAGDAFFIRKSFRGTWDLRTTVKKYFVEALVEDPEASPI